MRGAAKGTLGVVAAFAVGLGIWLLIPEGRRAAGPQGGTEKAAEAAPHASAELEPVDSAPEEPASIAAPTREPVPVVQAPPADDSGGDRETDPTLVVLAVSEDTSEPLPGVRLILSPAVGRSSATYVDDSRGSVELAPRTDETGSATFDVPPGVAFRLDAVGEGGPVGIASVDVPPFGVREYRELVLEIPVGYLEFHGRVVTREKRLPVVGARVVVGGEVSMTTFAGGKESRSTRYDEFESKETDADGYFHFSLPPAQSLDGRVSAAGLGPATFLPSAGHETRDEALLLELTRGATLEGHVSDLTGVGVNGSTVHVMATGYGLNQSTGFVMSDVLWEVPLDASGSWRLVDLPPSVGLSVELRRKRETVWTQPEPIELEPGEVRVLDIVLGSGATLAGRVVLAGSGAPVADHDIWLLPASGWSGGFLRSYEDPAKVATTDEAGAFAFADVSPGPWQVGPAPQRSDRDPPGNELVAPAAQLVEITPEDRRKEILLEVHRGLYVRGSVVGPNGEPVKEPYVSGFAPGSDRYASTTGAEDGTFALGPLCPETYRLEAFRSGTAGPERSDSIDASPGDEGVVLNLGGGAAIRGRVLRADTGEPLRAQVMASSGERRWMGTWTKPDGRFALQGLEPGTYAVRAWTEELCGRLDGLVLADGEHRSDLRIALEPAAILVVRYEGREELLHVEVRVGGTPIHADAFERGGQLRAPFTPGEVTVSLRATSRTDTSDPRDLGERTVLLSAAHETIVAFEDP